MIYLQRFPLCAECARKGIVQGAEHVDHIKPVDGPDDPGFWDAQNHQALCISCHSRKTATEDGGFGRPRIHPVTGDQQGTELAIREDHREPE